MAGLPTSQDPNSPQAQIAKGEAQIAELDKARNAVRGIQQSSLKDLFNYDKSLSDRYSSPDSKMYLENAGDRQSAIAGYSGIAGGQITNLYDLTEQIRKQKDDLQASIDELKKKAAAGSGTSGLSPSSILGFLQSKTGLSEAAPPPPKKLTEAAANTAGSQIYYHKNDDGTFSYVVGTPGVQIDTSVYTPYVSQEDLATQTKDQQDQILSSFGVDRDQLARLAALEVIDPKMAQEQMKQYMVQATVGRKLEKDDIMAGVKSTDTDAVRQQKLEKFYTEGGGADASVRQDINKWKNISYLSNRALDLYNNGIKSKADQTELASVVSQLASFYATGEGGKTLSENEWALIAGAVPQPEIRKANVWQRALGIQPAQSGKIVDSKEQVTAKLEALLQTAQDRYPFLEGKVSLTPVQEKNLLVNSPGLTGKVLAADTASTQTPVDQLPPDQVDNIGVLGKVAKGAYTLIAQPIVEGIKGYTKLIGSAAVTAAAPALAEVMTPAAYDQLTGVVEDWVKQGYSNPTQAIITGTLQTAGGVGAAVDLATLGGAGTVKNLVKTAGKLGLRNVAFNAPIFGLGSALEAKREGLSNDEIMKRTAEGMLGQRFTGPFVGAFGDSPEAQAADITTMIVAPILGQKIINRIMTGESMHPVEIKPETYATEFAPVPDHEAQFAKAIQNGNLDEARAITDSLSDGNPYKDLYKQAIVGAENAPDANPNTLYKMWDGIRSRWAAKMFAADPESVTRSEELAKKAIAMTESKTLYGMAKEMPVVRQEAGKFVDSNIGKISDAIGPIDRDENVAIIMDKIDQSSVAQANPDLRNTIESTLRRLLYSGGSDMGGEMAQRGAVAQTTLSRMNQARKTLNSQIDSGWFEKGMPTASNTENLNAMKWIASSTIKDMIKESDVTGRISKAIDMEHVSFATEPVISKIVLKRGGSGQFGGITTRLYNFIANSFRAITEPIEISAIRASLGKENLTTLGSAGSSAAEVAASKAAQEAQGFQRMNMQPEMLDIIASNKAAKSPSGALKFVQDMAGRTGALMGTPGLAGNRSAQDAALRRLRSVKYK